MRKAHLIPELGYTVIRNQSIQLRVYSTPTCKVSCQLHSLPSIVLLLKQLTVNRS